MAAFAIILGGASGAALYKLFVKPAAPAGAAATSTGLPTAQAANGISAGGAQPATGELGTLGSVPIYSGPTPTPATPCRSCGGANPTMATPVSPLPTRPVLPVAPPPAAPTSPDTITGILTGSGSGFRALRTFY
jgi:hypothetical protein